MADEETLAEVASNEEIESEQKESNKGLSKTLKFAIAGIVGLAINGLIAYYLTISFVVPTYFSASSDSTAVIEEQVVEPVQATPAAVSKQPTDKNNTEISHGTEFFSVRHIVVNPYGTNGRRFLAMDMSLGVSNKSVIGELSDKDAQLRDKINTFLSRKTVAELTNIVSKRKIKKDIKTLLNGILEKGEVSEIYFTKYVLQ